MVGYNHPQRQKNPRPKKSRTRRNRRRRFFSPGEWVTVSWIFHDFPRKKWMESGSLQEIPNVGIPLASWDMKPEPIAKLNPAFCDALFVELVGYKPHQHPSTIVIIMLYPPHS
jgi:hypothetical protein